MENRRWCPGSSGRAQGHAAGRLPLRPVTVLGACVLGLSGGCAGQGTAEAVPIERAVRAFQTALATDPLEACMLLAPGTLMELETSGSCPEELAELGADGPGRIERVDVYGKHAMVETAQDTLFLARFDEDGWLVVAAGCVPHAQQPYDCDVEGG